MSALVGFARFWYDFIIGDDWIVAAVVAVTLAVLAWLGHATLWWVLPLMVLGVLGVSLWRATRA